MKNNIYISPYFLLNVLLAVLNFILFFQNCTISNWHTHGFQLVATITCGIAGIFTTFVALFVLYTDNK